MLLRNETVYNLILGLVNRMCKGEQAENQAIFITVYDNDEKIIGQAIRTDPTKALLLGDLKQGVAEYLAIELKDHLQDLKGVMGRVELAQDFAKAWERATQVLLHMGVYELDNVEMPNEIMGIIRLATLKDLPIVEEFSLGYIQDCFPNQNRSSEATEAAKRNIENNYLYLYEVDGAIVSMAANNRESKNAGTIAWVYTPKEFRGKGYGSAITALLSKKILDNGKTICNLFTDLTNPTSNSIYQKLGYKKLGELLDLHFI